MPKYYGVERSSEYLAHYGIRGMKWGVRKAIERGDRAAISRHYLKASKKLAKLSLKANRGVQQKLYNSAKQRMVSGALGSAIGSAGLTAALHRGSVDTGLRNAGIAGAAGLVGGALLNSRGILAGRHVSDRGHARAIRKRNEWNRQMTEAFKGTDRGGKEQHKFQQQIMGISDSGDPRRYVSKRLSKADKEISNTARSASKQIIKNQHAIQSFKNATKSAAIGAVGGLGAANAYTAKKIADRETPSNTKLLYQHAKDTSSRLEAAEAKRDKSFLGRHGFGKTQKEYLAARNEAKQAYSNYYDSLSKKQQRRLRRNHVG